ncbi:hypothetical protein UA08_03101 [Talaromyces atroroseus]|uniref:Transcription factor domain-containing protein n=1 Tax=Talaromyces atroroseus TaxID=1441469 RepID=A0A225AJ59_TALAT|nr:hypothetical protein UA08_03101 [Talaromyces atroroseus]OKL61512.1 hypothetical protein UA08_03101 [Talaromyces atroroseus]
MDMTTFSDRLRCDRKQPCSTCTDRGLMANSRTSNPVMSGTQGHLQEGSPNEAINSQHSPAQSDGGSVWFSSSNAYVGGTHWVAILDGIADIKERRLEREDVENLKTPPIPHTLLLYGLLQSIGPSAMARTLQPVFTVYERFWENPSQTSVMWLGLLFSMICLAVLASTAAESSSSPGVRNPLVDPYREKIVQCLILGEVFHPERCRPGHLDPIGDLGQHSSAYGLPSGSVALSRDLFVCRGNATPDLGHDPAGRYFDFHSDGHATHIKDWQCDTVEPRNLNDSDFDEGSSVIPPSRPETEITTVSHLIARRRIFVALGAIVDLPASVRPVVYDEVMRLNQMLHDAEATVPNYLRMKAMATAVIDPPQVIMHRLFLRLMFHKGQVMLHCRYLSMESTVSANGQTCSSYSRSSCIEAALGILEIERILDEQTSPDGQLYMMRWRASSFMKHEFLTATMLLCFIARQRRSSPDVDDHHLDRIMAALTRAHGIWIRSRNTSVEAKTAPDALSIVLAKQSGDSNMSTECLAISNDFTLNSALPMPFPTGGLNGDGLEESFYYGFPFIVSSQVFPSSAMAIDPNVA